MGWLVGLTELWATCGYPGWLWPDGTGWTGPVNLWMSWPPGLVSGLGWAGGGHWLALGWALSVSFLGRDDF